MKAIKFTVIFSIFIVIALMGQYFMGLTNDNTSVVPTDAVPMPPTPIPTDNSAYPTPGSNDVTLPITDMTKVTPNP